MTRGEGWIMLHRRILKSRVFNDPEMLKLWIWCLSRASHAAHYFPIVTGKGKSDVYLRPGQFIFGRKSAALQLKMKPSSVRYRMEKLKKWRNLDTQPCHHYTLVTICNWARYQNAEKKLDTPISQPFDTQLTPNEHPIDTYNNGNKGKNVKNPPEGEGVHIRGQSGNEPESDPFADFAPPDPETLHSVAWEIGRDLGVPDSRWDELTELLTHTPMPIVTEAHIASLDKKQAVAEGKDKLRKTLFDYFLGICYDRRMR